MADRGLWVTGLRLAGNVRRLMYQTLIWPAVPRHDASGLGAALNTENGKRLTDALVDRVRRNSKLARNFLGRQMLVDKAQAVELSGRQPSDSLLNVLIGRSAVWPPIAVRQAVSILPSDPCPAQHFTQPSEHRVRAVL
jgi:hypothetical protein